MADALIELENYYPIHKKLYVNCESSSCPHFSNCCKIPTDYFTYENGIVDFFFIGQGGGEEEEKTNTPFIGAAGQRLRSIVKWMLDDGHKFSVAFSNSIRCRPVEPNITKKKNRDPYPDEIQKCLPNLDRDISILMPKVIIPLGNNSTKAFIPMAKGKAQDDHGKFFTIKIPSKWQLAMPTYHPSFLIRNGRKFKLDVPNRWDLVVKADLISAIEYINRAY